QADVVEHRGVGLMQGLEFDHPVAEIINKALDKGLVLINAGTNIIRFLPPLVITEADVDAMLEILKECL
ncbi:MAG: aminotransferase class III-fold pyridoxal phosphate-dependent enzyme, partial [Lachnospiraceae bacterium]|nr:aminotransferase class III-fold pyridoxal phosphate-dependent enzyme [Lachnospiraceae bacterium]